MGWFQDKLGWLFKSEEKKNEERYISWLSDSKPLFQSFGKDVYYSDFVGNVIDRIASEISKIDLKSIVDTGSKILVQNDDITNLFRFQPNPLQTTSDFFSNVEWIRRKHGNVFIYPQYEVIWANGKEYKRYTAIYPLNPESVEIGVSKDGTVWEIKMTFKNGDSYVIPYENLIHLKWRRGINTIIGGGNDFGMMQTGDLRNTLDALDKTIQGLPKAIEASLQVKGVYTAKSLMGKDQMNASRDEFEKHIKTSKTGIVAIGLDGEFTPVNMQAAEIPTETMDFLKAIIRERYGVSEAILSGDYNGEQHAAFYQSEIEDFLIQFEQASSRVFFSKEEQMKGHQTKCYYSRVNYMSTQDKMKLADISKETGIQTLNQINEMFGLLPFEGGDRRIQSLNFMNIEKVDEYQEKRVEQVRKQKEAQLL